MADYIYYVNPASSGGSGTNDTLTGGTAAYQTLNAAVTARAGSHGSGNTITYRCSGNGSSWIDSSGVNLSSHTEDAVIVEGYNGNYVGYNTGSVYTNTACYALEVSTSSTHTLTVGITGCTIRNLQANNTSSTNFYYTLVNSANVANWTVYNCRVKASKSNSTKTGGGIIGSGAISYMRAYNNTCEGNGNSNALCVGIECGSGASGTPCEICNNTVYGFATGIKTHNYFYYYFYNNAIVGCTNDWLFGGSENITASHTADSADGDTPGSNNTTCVATAATDFTNCATGDFTVVSGGALHEAGTSNSYTPSTDIAGQTRS